MHGGDDDGDPEPDTQTMARRRATKAGVMEAPDPVRYRSAFRSWDTKSWIRSKPHRAALFDARLAFFAPSAVPLLAIPEARRLPIDVRDDLCVRHLQWHLAMTVPLELGPVNDACIVIRDSEHTRTFPRELRHDVLRLYADEAGHAEMMSAMCDAVEDATGVAAPSGQPQFVRRVGELVAAAEPSRRDLVRFVAGLVSETLITVALTAIPLDDRVQRPVRELLADHAEDERRHAALFRDAVVRLWPALPLDARRAVGVLVPDMLLAFLEPDRAELAATAAAYPEWFPDVPAVVEAAVRTARATPGFRDAAASTVRALRDAGAFTDDDVVEAFRATGFLPGSAPALVTA